ncbi:MAG: hypothetical protein KF745_05070 [Phycisphaeraceae bacterium]|nr:hypothetical protein [Phycisphaeraceae bacterium]
MRTTITRLVAVICVLIPAGALAWGGHGHRTVTLLALAALPADMPAFLRDPATSAMIAEQANEPDRWRGTPVLALAHENNPEHYIDIEQLEQFGLTIDSLPPLRYDYMQALIVAKHVHPERVDPYDRRKNADGSQEWPGLAPWAIVEHYAKLRSAFNTYRILQAVGEQGRDDLVALARLNIIAEMGILSHYVGDCAQPLHTTIHHHGWVGANPGGYTTEWSFHSYIDSAILSIHSLSTDTIPPISSPLPAINAADPFNDVIAYIKRSHAAVEPLYQLHKDGRLTGPEGKAFIEARLTDAASMLAALYAAAWTSSAPTDGEVASFIKYSENRSLRAPRETPAAGLKQ